MLIFKSGAKRTSRLMAGLLMGIVLMALMAGCAQKEPAIQNTLAPAQTNEAQPQAQSEAGEDVIIPVSDISETALFVPAEVDGVKMEIIAVKAPDGSIRTAFNTCQVCFDSGKGYYEQEGDKLVCQNCGNSFGMGDVELAKGGCNPVPIPKEYKTVTADTITIPYDLLKQAKELFAGWKV